MTSAPAIIVSERLRKPVRNETLPELGTSTLTRLRESIADARLTDALELANYFLWEGKRLHDLMCDWVYANLDFVGHTLGEEAVYKALRYAGEKIRRPYVEHIAKLTVEERVFLQAEGMRSHRSGPGEIGDMCIVEEDDRYVMSFDPCGSGGRMRRTGQIDKLPPRTGPPYNFGKTSKPYPWSWSKIGVPYYCLHCCVWSEIQAIEWLGFPFRITDYEDDPEKPCRFLFYKRPELIPEHFLERIDKSRADLRIST